MLHLLRCAGRRTVPRWHHPVMISATPSAMMNGFQHKRRTTFGGACLQSCLANVRHFNPLSKKPINLDRVAYEVDFQAVHPGTEAPWSEERVTAVMSGKGHSAAWREVKHSLVAYSSLVQHGGKKSLEEGSCLRKPCAGEPHPHGNDTRVAIGLFFLWSAARRPAAYFVFVVYIVARFHLARKSWW